MGANNLRIKAYRTLNEISQAEAASKLGIGLTSFCNKEQGKSSWTDVEIAKLANMFNVLPGDLFSSEPKLK